MSNNQDNGRPLPDGWTWTSLEQVCKVNPRMSFPEQFSDETPVSFVPMAAVDDVKGAIVAPEVRPIGEVWKGYTRFAEGDVIFAKITPCMENGKAAIAHGLVNGVGLGSTEFHVMRSSEAILPQWIYHFVRQSSFRGDAAAEMTGTAGQLRVPTLFMREANIPLAPLPEQRRIVAEIETQFTRLDAAVAGLERAQTALARYRVSVLQAACSGQLVPTEADLARTEGREYEPADVLLERILVERRARWETERWEYEVERAKKKAAQAERKAAGLPYYIRDLEPEHWEHRTLEEYEPYLPKGDKWKKRYDEPEPPDTEDLDELPKGWVWASFDQLLIELKNGYFGGRPASEPPGTPILRISAVRPLSVSFEDLRYLPEVEAKKISDYRLQEGDLLFTRYNGNLHLVGACGMVRKINEPVLYPDKLIRVRINQALILPSYLEIFFSTGTARHFIERRAKTTAGQYGIAGGELKQAVTALPPRAEQRRIVQEVERRLSLVEALEAAVEVNLRRAERLRQSILKRAFSGRLVPQDPGDEPASVLLARIQAEREGKADGKSKRKTKQKRLPGI